MLETCQDGSVSNLQRGTTNERVRSSQQDGLPSLLKARTSELTFELAL